MKYLMISAAALFVCASNVAFAAHGAVSVDFDRTIRPMKPEHGIGQPPMLGVDVKKMFHYLTEAGIPYSRLHDVGGWHGRNMFVDIPNVFRDFDADENDPASYDFSFTDVLMKGLVDSGVEPYYRLGVTIENFFKIKRLRTFPPKDYAKWARICEHVIRHYNEGWGWGLDTARTTRNIEYKNQFKIEYWEIWNEPDLDPFDDVEKNVGPRCWGGTVEEFFKFYETAAKYLKGKFPDLKIGGPAICGRFDWGERFLKYCHDTQTPLDFFSWHAYAVEPKTIADRCTTARALMDKYGFEKAESILNEWNYVKGWVDDFVYSLEVATGRFNQKAAAFIAATMIDCQQVPLDHLMFYDARSGNGMNCLFDKTTLWPMKGYYPYLCWAKLLDAGTQVRTSVKEGRGIKNQAATGVVLHKDAGATGGQYRAVAAKGADGSVVVFLARYSENNNETDIGTASVAVKGLSPEKARIHMTDAVRTHTEVPVLLKDDGTLKLSMMPNSFAIVEFPAK